MTSFIDKIYKEIGENDCNQDVKDWLSTGLMQLDMAMSGYYGKAFPVGRFTEVYGGESSGKTLLATMALIETQKKKGLAVFLDWEHAFSLSRAESLGLKSGKNDWIYKQPETAESGFKIIEFIANTVRENDSARHVTIVGDSIASMITQEEMAAGHGEGNMRTKLSLAAVMSSSLKKLTSLINRTNITLILLNQTRKNPAIMFGDPETTAGGNAAKFYASVRLKLSKGKKVKEGDEIIGECVKAQCIKNKVHIPFRTAEYVTHFERGINLELSHVEELVREKMIDVPSQGYVGFNGKKYRAKQLADIMRKDPKINEAVLKFFDNTKLKKAA